MIRLSAFADEISPDLDEQIAALSSEKVYFLDLRGAWNTNVLDLTDQQVARINETLGTFPGSTAAVGANLLVIIAGQVEIAQLIILDHG